MPIVKCTGLDHGMLLDLKDTMQEALAEKAAVTKEKVKIMLLPVWALTPCPPTIEIQLFERPQGQCDDLAQTFHALLAERGVKDCQIFYTFLTKQRYYKKGRPLEEYPAFYAQHGGEEHLEGAPLQ